MTPKVSIITPALVKDAQQLEWLNECCASVQGQTETDIEQIVVNDHSLVDLEPVKALYPQVRWLDAEYQGVSATRNQAVEAATAPLLLPLDADDLLASTAVEQFLAAWDDRQEDIVYSDVVMFGQDYSMVYLAPEYTFEKLLHATLMTVGSLHTKADWQRVGGWRLDMTKGLEDWEYWIALGEIGVCGERLPEPLYYYRRHPRGRLQWLKANQEKWDAAYQAMRELHIDSYNGRFPVGCCGGRAPKGARRPLHGGVPRAQTVAAATPAAGDLVKMIYTGARQGDFRLTAQPTRQQYYVPGQGQFVEIDQTGVQGIQKPDIAWFRSVSQGRDFKIVDVPVKPSVVPQVVSKPEPPAKPVPKDSKAWAPEVMEPRAPRPRLVTVSITPKAQDLAEEHGIDWTKIIGTGKGGNVTIKDVRAAID